MSLWPLAAWLLTGFALLNEPLLHVDEPQPVPWRWAWWAVGVAVLAWECRGRPARVQRLHPTRVALLVGCAMLVEGTVPAAGFATLAAAELAHARALSARAAAALAVAGRGLLAAALAALALPPILARHHALPFLNALAAGALRSCGVSAASGEDSLSLEGWRSRPEMALSVEKLGLGPALVLLLVTACAMVAFAEGRGVRRWLLLAGAWATYLGVRAVVLLAFAADSGELEAFIHPIPVLLGFLPAALLACLLVPRAGWTEQAARPERGFLPFVATVGCIVVALGAWDPGQPKSGRILVDEGHSEWEWTDAALDRSTFGERSTYNYASLFDFLARHYSSVERNEAPLTPTLLASCDVLVLKTPTRPYGLDELDALVDFVEEGGGLWLIGDHTNVFGTAMHLNPIASRFGLRFRADSVNDVGSEGLQLYSPPQIRRHPITVNMPDLLMATSCSLDVSAGASCAMIGNTLWADEAGYDAFNFFGDHDMDGTESWGQFVQAATVEVGRGRVAAYTDSTTLSSFSFFLPGNWEMCLSTVGWLNRQRNRRGLHLWQLLAGAGALLASVWYARREPRPVGALSVEGLACGVFLGFSAVDLHTAAHHGLPQPREPLRVVAFEMEHCRSRLPLTHEAHAWDEDNYWTFFVWSQRVGCTPRVAEDLDAGLAAPACVLIEPDREFTEAERASVDEYLRSGGRILLLDDPFDGSGTGEQLLSRYGMSFGSTRKFPAVSFDTSAQEGSTDSLRVGSAFSVSGGTPFLHSTDGEVLGAFLDVGEGRLVAVGVARPFAVQGLGMPIEVPSRAQRLLAQLEFRLFDVLFDCAEL